MHASTEPAETAQDRFDRLYITSTEIGASLNVARSSVMNARRNGLLPQPIKIMDGHVYIWEREQVLPYVEAWRIVLSARRASAAK